MAVKKSRYVIAAVITASIFLLGLMLGLVIEGKRASYSQEMSRRQLLEYNSLQLQYEYIDDLSQEKDCPALEKAFDSSVENLETARIRLENYDKRASINKDEFDFVKRDYILAQLQYWLFAKRLKKMCNTNTTTVLYFFSTDEKCPKCGDQAFILTYLKKVFHERLLNFAIDSDYENEPMIKILKETYGITVYPTLVIENRKFEGFVPKEDILKELCNQNGESEECRNLG